MGKCVCERCKECKTEAIASISVDWMGRAGWSNYT